MKRVGGIPTEGLGPDIITALGGFQPEPNDLQSAVLGSMGDLIDTPWTVATGLPKAYAPLVRAIGDRCGRIAGDPHVHTMDGAAYDFQAAGEFFALRSEDGALEVQVRLVPAGDSGLISRVQGVALRVDGRVLVVDGDPSAVTLDGEPFEAPQAVITDHRGMLIRDDTTMVVLWPDAYTTVSITGIGRRFLGVYPTLGADRKGAVAGLLGNADGNPANDLALPDGTMIDRSFATLTGAYRDAWRVPEDEMLFAPPSVFDPSLPAAQTKLPADAAARARSDCLAAGVQMVDVLSDCTLDVALTGDTTYATRAASEQPPRLRVPLGCDQPVGAAVYSRGMQADNTFWSDTLPITGQLAWAFSSPDGRPSSIRALAPVPDGLLAVENSGFRLLGRDGKQRAAVEAPLRGRAPAVSEQRAYLVTENGLISTTLDGRPCWVLKRHEDERFEDLAIGDGILLATARASGLSILLALDPADGSELWARAFDGGIVNPALAEGVVAVGTGSGVMALDAATGSQRWHMDGEHGIEAVAISDGVLFASERNTGLAAFATDDGHAVWRSPEPRGATSFAVHGTHLVAVSGRSAYDLDSADGSVRWQLGDDKSAFSQPVLVRGAVYFVTLGDGLAAYALNDGAELFHADLPDVPDIARAAVAPLPSGDLVLIYDYDGRLQAYR